MNYRFPDFRDRTLPRLLAHQVERRGGSEFMQFCGNVPLTYARMDELSNRFARGLTRLGVSKGNRLAMLLPNCEEFVPLWFAAAKLGAIEVPINPAMKDKLLRYLLKDCEASVLVCHSSVLENVAAALMNEAVFAHVIVIGGDATHVKAAGIACDSAVTASELASELASPVPIDIVDPSDPIAIMYTSGTTGSSKGVILPHHQYYVWAERMAASMALTSDDVYFTPLPLFHGDAQFFGVYFPLVYGARGVIHERFSASRYWDQVRGCRATATNLLGAMAHILWRQNPSPRDAENGIRVCQSIPMVTMQSAFEERFLLTLVTGYGQTETSLVTFDTPNARKAGSCGMVDPYYEIAIVDEDDNILPAGRVGEIVIRPTQPWTMFRGYFGQPVHSVHAWRNLWFHSGDTGCLDDEGWLYFKGRIKDVIRRRGENISAEEVEAIVEEHPLVLECAAVAVSSELSEDEIKVVVVRRANDAPTAEELWNFCRAKAARHMVPRYIEFSDGPLPRTPTEKIAKVQLRARGINKQTWDSDAAGMKSNGR
jgi:carnitine-CoA ligase